RPLGVTRHSYKDRSLLRGPCTQGSPHPADTDYMPVGSDWAGRASRPSTSDSQPVSAHVVAVAGGFQLHADDAGLGLPVRVVRAGYDGGESAGLHLAVHGEQVVGHILAAPRVPWEWMPAR